MTLTNNSKEYLFEKISASDWTLREFQIPLNLHSDRTVVRQAGWFSIDACE